MDDQDRNLPKEFVDFKRFSSEADSYNTLSSGEVVLPPKFYATLAILPANRNFLYRVTLSGRGGPIVISRMVDGQEQKHELGTSMDLVFSNMVRVFNVGTRHGASVGISWEFVMAL